MTTFKDWSISFVAAALLVFSLQTSADERLQFQLTPASIEPGQRTTLRVTLRLDPYTGSEPEGLEIHDSLLTEGKDWAILSSKRILEKNQAEWIYELSAYRSGPHRIPPIEVSIRGASFSTETVELNVSTSRPEKDLQIRPGFGVLELPVYWGPRIALVLGVLLASLLTFWLARYLVRRFKARPKPLPVVVSPAVPAEDPRLWLQRQLQEYRTKLQNEKLDPLVIDEFVSILKRYFAKAQLQNARALTTRELTFVAGSSPALKKAIPLFERCDGYRFHPTQPDPRALAHECLHSAEKEILACI